MFRVKYIFSTSQILTEVPPLNQHIGGSIDTLRQFSSWGSHKGAPLVCHRKDFDGIFHSISSTYTTYRLKIIILDLYASYGVPSKFFIVLLNHNLEALSKGASRGLYTGAPLVCQEFYRGHFDGNFHRRSICFRYCPCEIIILGL